MRVWSERKAEQRRTEHPCTHAFAEAEDAVHQHDRRRGAVEQGRGLVLARDGDVLGGHEALHEGGRDVGGDSGAEDVEGVAEVDGRTEEQLGGAQRAHQRRPHPLPHTRTLFLSRGLLFSAMVAGPVLCELFGGKPIRRSLVVCRDKFATLSWQRLHAVLVLSGRRQKDLVRWWRPPPSSPFGFIGDPNVQLTCGSTQLNIVQKVHVAPLLYGRVWLVCHKWPHALVAGSVGGAWFAERWG